MLHDAPHGHKNLASNVDVRTTTLDPGSRRSLSSRYDTVGTPPPRRERADVPRARDPGLSYPIRSAGARSGGDPHTSVDPHHVHVSARRARTRRLQHARALLLRLACRAADREPALHPAVSHQRYRGRASLARVRALRADHRSVGRSIRRVVRVRLLLAARPHLYLGRAPDRGSLARYPLRRDRPLRRYHRRADRYRPPRAPWRLRPGVGLPLVDGT